MRRFAITTLSVFLCLGCGEGTLEVKGNLNRVVGETVTLELLEGQDDFTGEIRLVGSDRTKYDTNQLGATLKNPRKLSFTIPGDVAPGEATARVTRKGSDLPYDVPLRVNRLALTMDAVGLLEILPLPPTTMTPGSMSVGGGKAGLMSLSPKGGLLALFASDQLRLLSLGAKPKDLTAPISQKEGKCLAALNDGMLVGTATQVIYLKQVAGKGMTRASDFSLPGCTDISVDNAGTTALVLSRWDSSGGAGTPDSDALTELTLGASPTKGSTLKVDSAPGATAVSLAGDGKSGVIVDGPAVYGVILKGSGQFSFSQLHWGFAAKPVSVSSTGSPALVSKQKVYVHAMAETSKGQIRFAAHDQDKLKWVYQGTKQLAVDLTTQGTPSAIAFGRRLELYVAADRSVYLVKDLAGTPKIISMGMTTTNKITSLAVQP